MKKILSGMVLLYLATSLSVAQNIHFRNICVKDSGSVALSWERDSGSATGNTLNIYSSFDAKGAFSLVASIADTSTSYVHNGASADVSSRFYFLKGASLHSDTLSTLYLGLENRGGSIANLVWVPLRLPASVSPNNVIYTIFRNGTNSSPVASTSALEYQDTVTNCGDTLKYVLTASVGGCNYTSPVRKDFFSDFTSPDTVRLDSVSLRPDSHYAEMGWQKCSSKDVFGYITYIYKDGIWQAMDTLYGAENRYYADSVYADGNVHQYRVAAMDTCRNVSPLGEIHHNLKLSASPSKCDSVVVLSWNAYSHMPMGVGSSEIFVSAGGGPYTLFGTENSASTSYTCRHLDVLQTYSFYVRVWNTDKTISSTSTVETVDFNRVMGHGKVYIRSLGVNDDNQLELKAYVPDSVVFNHLIMWRKTPNDSLFMPIDTVSRSGNTYTWVQPGLDLEHQIYYYKVQLTDECDLSFAESVEARNIVLDISKSGSDENQLQWNAYQGFARNPDDYAVYRRPDPNSVWELLGVTTPFVLSYCDAVQDAVRYEYRVAARGSNSELPFDEECYSNVVSLDQEPVSYIPNSFVPSSAIEANRVFKPVVLYVDASEYKLTIFDRWGQVVFETNLPDEGWDGNIKGKPASAGVYVYQLSYRLNEKKMCTKRGMVNLIR